MRNEIKIPINKNFDLYFYNWKDFKHKITRPFNDRIINTIYYDTDNYITAQDNLAGISKRSKYRVRQAACRSFPFGYGSTSLS